MTELAELSNVSKSYISQVKRGVCPASERLLNSLTGYHPKEQQTDYVALFLQSRAAMGASPQTLRFYRQRLGHFVDRVDYIRATRQSVERYLNCIPPNKNGLATRHASFRAIKTFYRWLHSQFGLNNVVSGMAAPILGKPLLPALSAADVSLLLKVSRNCRDRAIIALLTESGLRLSELVKLRTEDIDWGSRVVRVMGKGRKEGYAPFGRQSEQYLREWLSSYVPSDNIWGLNAYGVAVMLRRLREKTGLPCNPHTFRRTFACLLRKAGVDTMTIKDLGRWESLEMVQRYTRSVSFHDSLKFYRAPLSTT